MGLHHRQPPALAVAVSIAGGLALSDAAHTAAAIRLPRRHGARAGRSESAFESGAGAYV